MVTVQQLYKRHTVNWVTASPLWKPYTDQGQPSKQSKLLNPSINFREPAILRFTSDSFMEDFLKVAMTDPERLNEWRVQPETWRIPAPTPPVTLRSNTNGKGNNQPKNSSQKQKLDDLSDEQRAILEAQDPIKLYQPANQRFYLVTASLVCRIPGLPDRMLNLSKGENVSFVLRRLIKDKDNQEEEYAFINEAWYRIPSFGDKTPVVEKLYPGEQQFPMFPVTYDAKIDGHKRRMFAGLVPVSNREKFINAEINTKSFPKNLADSTSGSNPESRESQIDRLMTVIDMDVLQPWDALLEQCEKFRGNSLVEGIIAESYSKIISSNESTKTKREQLEALKKTIQEQRDQFQIASWYLLLDFARFLKTYMSPVWQVLSGNTDKSTLGENTKDYPARQFLETLQGLMFKPGTVDIPDNLPVSIESKSYKSLRESYYSLIEGQTSTTNATNLVSVLKQLLMEKNSEGRPHNDFLETVTVTYDAINMSASEKSKWPTEFLLCGRRVRDGLDRLRDTRDPETRAISTPGLLRSALGQILQDKPKKRIPVIPVVPLAQKISQSAIQQASKNADNNIDENNERFYIRCVFQCPNCPPSLSQVVSQPTLKFQMASYFDPDAPARPIRIPLPVDTTPAGLRKFTKNTMFAISDSLACQIELARKLTFGDLVLSVLPWPFHKDLPDPRAGKCKKKGIDIGKICTLSIPIITICALILLIIIVLLLDQIFKWVPYLIFCLPLPGLKAKKGGNS